MHVAGSQRLNKARYTFRRVNYHLRRNRLFRAFEGIYGNITSKAHSVYKNALYKESK